MIKKLFLLLAFIFLADYAGPALRAQATLPPLAREQVALIRKIEGRLMAPCCYTQTIRDHDSQVAVDMRNEVTAFVASGKSEEEIITYYRTKYGETILVVPDGLTGHLLTILPMTGFLVATGVLCLFIRRNPLRGGAAPLQRFRLTEPRRRGLLFNVGFGLKLETSDGPKSLRPYPHDAY